MCKSVSVPGLHWACPALSSSRAVIKEELQSHSELSLRKPATPPSQNPLTSTRPPSSPFCSPTPKAFHPHPSLCSWLGCKLGNFPLYTITRPFHRLCPVQRKKNPTLYRFISFKKVLGASREVFKHVWPMTHQALLFKGAIPKVLLGMWIWGSWAAFGTSYSSHFSLSSPSARLS